ncbi:hypothetical protein [Cellulomonas fimi]|uniref:Uncharacterized protein n=1 Tax=Cellulomonas fimi TaxID=1708 RepID=A0A7Y0QH85_CELFI|nr:hypothetical protein [Cellulomonas fimi]NMR20025.1 hypothetical protein [Cellulomonas fimi]
MRGESGGSVVAHWSDPGWAGSVRSEEARRAAVLLAAADDAVAQALALLRAADDVTWASQAAVRYRVVLADAAAGVRLARGRLSSAAAAVAAHGEAVRQVREAQRCDVTCQLAGVASRAGLS